MTSRRHFIRNLTLLAMSLPLAAHSVEEFPSKTITIVIPLGPGTGFETVIRHMAEHMSEKLGQSVIIENKPGANNQIGLNHVAHSKPEGYVIGLGFITNLILARHVYTTLPYDPFKDFVPIALLGENYLGLVVNNNVPATDVASFIEYAKNKPGGVNVGTTSVGGLPHLAFEQLAATADIPFTIVTYNSNPEIVQDLIGGQLDAGIPDFSGTWPMVKGKQIKLLGITYHERDKNHPENPTIGETIDGYQADGWFGFVAPKGTPRSIVEKLNVLINEAINSPKVKEAMDVFAILPNVGSPEQFGELMAREDKKYTALIKKIGFEPLANN